MKRKNNYLLLLVVILGISVVLLGGYFIYDKILNNKKANILLENNTNTTIDYSNEIISHFWCKDKNEKLTTCLQFEEDRIYYGEPNTDAVTDSVKFDKIIKESDYIYKIYGSDGYIYAKEDDDEPSDEYNIVWTIRYNNSTESITILEGKRTYLSGKVETVKAYSNNDLNKRNSSL